MVREACKAGPGSDFQSTRGQAGRPATAVNRPGVNGTVGGFPHCNRSRPGFRRSVWRAAVAQRRHTAAASLLRRQTMAVVVAWDGAAPNYVAAGRACGPGDGRNRCPPCTPRAARTTGGRGRNGPEGPFQFPAQDSTPRVSVGAWMCLGWSGRHARRSFTMTPMDPECLSTVGENGGGPNGGGALRANYTLLAKSADPRERGKCGRVPDVWRFPTC